MYKYFFPLVLALYAATLRGQEASTFSSAQIREDIAYLRSELESRHPGLYLYSSRAEADALFDSLYRQIPPSVTETEAYRLITTVCSVIRDGHTIFYPAERSTAYHDRYSGFFPFKIYWRDSSMYVAMNYSASTEIPDGSEIISINGVAASEIMSFSLKRMMHDGYNQTYPVWVMNNWFNEFYSYFYGHPAAFDVSFRSDNGAVTTKTIRALSKTEISANRKKNYPDYRFDKKEGDGLVLETEDTNKTATLTIRDFHADILKKVYGQKFKKTIAEYFRQIEAKGVENLILDLRNNQGGDTRYGEILLSYVLNDPFRYVEGYRKVGKHPAAAPQDRNKKCKGPAMGICRPRSNVFKGNLYILINGGSFSNTGIVVSALKHARRGIMIGEETGGNGHVICGSVKYRELPNTKIRVEIPTLQFAIRDPEHNTGKGVFPDYFIQPSIEQLVGNRDIAKEYAKGMIKNSKSKM